MGGDGRDADAGAVFAADLAQGTSNEDIHGPNDVTHYGNGVTSRQTTPRQDPLPPEVGFGELMTRMITANRVEIAKRMKADSLGRARVREETEPRPTPHS